MIDQLKNRIREANEAYRIGKPVMSDVEYDILVEELTAMSPNDELLSVVGHEILDETRKTRLPIPMASMNKIKTLDEIKDWQRLKLIPNAVEIICTPKYDGLSLCVDEVIGDAITRGDGVYGQHSTEHYRFIGNHLDINNIFSYSYGEVIMPKKVFLEKYSNDFANPRNLVAGLINSKTPSESLRDCNYIKYGAVPAPAFRNHFTTKQQVLDTLNDNQKVKVPYHVCGILDLSEELLISLFKEWSEEYEIDGIILEVNNLNTQNSLGRETSSGNPVFARAFKHESFEQKAESEVIGISWNISKQGLLKPIIHINPIRLDGVTVSNVTGNNARFIKDMGIGIGARVIVKRSGMVIPKIVDVVQTVDFVEPTIEGVEIGWNEAGIELITLTETEDQKLKKIVAFFEILEADSFGEGIITLLYNNGYKKIEDILMMNNSDLECIDGIGKRKASIIIDSIKKSTTDVDLSKLMHATSIFKGLGSKKLKLVEHFKSKPKIEDILSIEGFAEISANTFIDGFDEFYEFCEKLHNLTFKKEVEKSSNILIGKSFCFTGVRLPEFEKIIIDNGGKISSSVSKSLTYLVCKDVNSGSSKLIKAISLGVVLLDIEKLEELLRGI
jgi:NAD-dependent DNA ligase